MQNNIHTQSQAYLSVSTWYIEFRVFPAQGEKPTIPHKKSNGYILHSNICIQILELNYIDQVIPNKNTGISEANDFIHCVCFVLPPFIDFLRQSFHHSVLFSCIAHVCTCCYIEFKFFIKTSKSTRQFHSRQKIYYLMICVESFIYSSNLSAKFIQSTSDLIIQKTCHFSSGQIS